MKEIYWFGIEDRDKFLAGKPVLHLGLSEGAQSFSITM